MSEKKWTLKLESKGRRGRHHKGKEFPRHATNLYEGTHLGMRKRIWSKSNPGCVYGRRGCILRKEYIIGLLNRFVGKPFKDFKIVFDAKLRELVKDKHNITWWKLEHFLHDKPKDCYCYQEFYLDDNGLIQRCKLRKRRSNKLSKYQIRFNEKVKIPDLGICRNNPKYQVIKSYWGMYESGNYSDHTKTEPILLGKFYVSIDKKVFKLPVYTCLSKYLVEYAEYNPSHYDYDLHKYVNIPYEQYKSPSEERDVKLYKKRLRVIKDWIPVRVYPSSKLMGQDCWILLNNHRIEELKTSIANYERLIQEEQSSSNIETYKKEILKAYEELKNIPEKQYYNMGYGKFYLFVKRFDFEREIANMV